MKTLLIVDDNEQNLYMLEVLLSARGFKVEKAFNGFEALEKARRAPPDMIISDILMPVMDGFALCRSWRGDKKLKNIPFVFYTATYTEHEDENFALSLGADRFITKPIEPSKFLEIISRTLENFKTAEKTAPRKPLAENGFYKKYNAALFRKLEDKMLQLERVNHILENDVAERKQAEKILRESENKYRTLIENIPQKIYFKNKDSVYISCNLNYARDLKISPHEIAGKTDYDFFPEELADKYRADDKRIMGSGATAELEEIYVKDGVKSWVRTIKTPVSDKGILGIFWDITERKQADEERRKLEKQMIQNQKVESVGRLAGSIAHDFNNMLTVICSCAELALPQLAPEHPVYAYLKDIQTAANRSAELTKQLLTFARKQPARPKVLRLNDTVRNMLKILQLLIGENIKIVWNPGADLWPVKLDPSQVDQLLANLCLNARDAISGKGEIAIETGNAPLDAAAKRQNAIAPGSYVKISVRDNGCGMDKETLTHIFEPFFTTKRVGQGAGLGLATVYGIVKQNEGYINVLSKPGHGTTFEIYFPRNVAAAKTAKPEKAGASPGEARHGKETVLVVEDEPQLIKLIWMILESLDYKVLIAVTPGEAIRLAEKHTGPIHLLVTDLVMPEMNGLELSREILKRHPKIKSLFMSGHSPGLIGMKGFMEENADFIQKPYSIRDLAAKVREVLDRKQDAEREE
ncbi:MAG: response regulator [Kiritimatiellae bacterium]|jgi:PAS domain S-box-containing protein|nr:response regulator [Kiritimatiellia bacterium]